MADYDLRKSVGVPTYSSSPEKHAVHWFRRGLRLSDNPALRDGLQGAATFRCVYVLDPQAAYQAAANKWRFLLQSLIDLDRSLRRLNSRLFVIRGQPAEIFPQLVKLWRVNVVSWEEEPEPWGRERDHAIESLLRSIGVRVICRTSHTLYKVSKLLEFNDGLAPLTYPEFLRHVVSMDPPLPPCPTVLPTDLAPGCYSPIDIDHDLYFGVPTIEELGLESESISPCVWPGGETEALCRLSRHLERQSYISLHGRPLIGPESLLPATSSLGPYLRFGCLSARLFYDRLSKLYYKIKKEKPPLHIYGQLLWREFLYTLAYNSPKLDSMRGNPVCVPIPWDKDDHALIKWAWGKTGFPFIDAVMTQLRCEGWIHHLGKHAVVSFLTRGDLFLSWEEGCKIFEDLSLDSDWAISCGTWLWLSGSSFFQSFLSIPHPTRFGKRLDPNGLFIRQYVPELRHYPVEYIHEPWLAPLHVQQQCACILGYGYPLPMLDHLERKVVNTRRLVQAYHQLISFRKFTDTLKQRILVDLVSDGEESSEELAELAKHCPDSSTSGLN